MTGSRDAPVRPPRRSPRSPPIITRPRRRPQRGEGADPLERGARIADQVLVAQVEELVGGQAPREVVGAADGASQRAVAAGIATSGASQPIPICEATAPRGSRTTLMYWASGNIANSVPMNPL